MMMIHATFLSLLFPSLQTRETAIVSVVQCLFNHLLLVSLDSQAFCRCC